MAENRRHGRNVCVLCNQEDIDEDPLHLSSQTHLFNFQLFAWNSYRKALVKNRNGIEVDVVPVRYSNNNLLYETNTNHGTHMIKVTPAHFEQHAEGLKYSFKIINIQSANNMHLTSATLLHPSKYFIMTDPQNHLHEGRILDLEPKASYEVFVTFTLNATCVGIYAMPIAFNFQTVTEPVKSFTISREMKIVICEDAYNIGNSIDLPVKSPFTSAVWRDMVQYLPPTKNIRFVNKYEIPPAYENVLKAGLEMFNGMTEEDMKALAYLKNQLKPGYPTVENYPGFFHTTLWLDEIGASVMLSRYNMENVTMKVLPVNRMLELEVPGLAEKRPSLIVGDMINIRFQGDHTAYMGIIKAVNDATIHIAYVDEELVNEIEDDDSMELDVSFILGRLSYERMHEAVDNCINRGILPTLFPTSELARKNINNTYTIEMHQYFNKNILNNQEQKTAVKHILNRSSGQAPYIVFGPPGTGKTLTIVEAILQIKTKIKDAKILVCAPANSACDMLASKLVESNNCTKDELIRIHSESREWNSVPEDIKPYSNRDGKEYTKIGIPDIVKYRIVVTTLVLCGKYSGKYHADFVFIDEAAQALEPEADIAISMKRRQDSSIILAGDPKQLGPICSSAVAEKYNFGVSLLERLMKENPLYQNNDPNFITMLKLNFRTHPRILHLPNELFYNNELIAVSQFPIQDPIANILISNLVFKTNAKKNNKKTHPGQPIEFCCIIAQEKREGKSPSYFNESEVQTVVKYVRALMNLDLNVEHKIKELQIGIITPYIRQVYRIKGALNRAGFANIEVGTTESFQGREKRIIIISTVRAQHSLLLHDRRYNLGFVKHAKRFNVALTRAMSKLIVIGCPHVLGTDKKWLKYIDMCESLHAYVGPKYQRRNSELKQDVIKRLSKLHQN